MNRPLFESLNPKDLVRRLQSLIPLCLLILIYFSVRSLYWNCQPVWDAAHYYESLLEANRAPFNLLNFTCDGHICQGFFLVMSLPYFLFRRDYYLFNIWLTLFGTLSIVAFYRLLRFFSGGRAGNVELALVTAVFAFHPSVLASMIHFNIDIGVVTFFLWYWLLLLEKRTIPAAILGVLLILSKETALLLLPLPFLFCWLVQPKGTRRVWLRRHWWACWTPYCVFAAILLYKFVSRGSVLWIGYHDSSPAQTLASAVTPDPMLTLYGGMILIMNFNWIVFSTWLGLTFVSCRRCSASNPCQPVSLTILLWLLFSAALIVVLLVRPYACVRYCMVLIPIMLLGVAWLGMDIVRRRSVRIIAAILLLVLLGLGDFHTIDPLSKMFFGTFQFGNHEMLSVNRRNSDWTDVPVGIDQLAYNLQFLKLVQLTDRILLDLHPKPNTFILCRPFANWHFLPRLNPVTFEPSFALDKSFAPQYSDFWPLNKDYESLLEFSVAGRTFQLNQLPFEFFYIAFPTFDNRSQIQNLKQRYRKTEYKTYFIQGYSVTVIRFSTE